MHRLFEVLVITASHSGDIARQLSVGYGNLEQLFDVNLPFFYCLWISSIWYEYLNKSLMKQSHATEAP